MLTILAVQTFRICVLAAVTESEFVSSRKPRNQKNSSKTSTHKELQFLATPFEMGKSTQCALWSRVKQILVDLEFSAWLGWEEWILFRT